MSRARTVMSSLSLTALAALGACATSGETTSAAQEEDIYRQAIADAMTPATEEEKATADRSDPLTRANFWSNEYQKNANDLDTTLSFMKALRALGSYERVSEIAASSLPIHPDSYELFLEVGRAQLADNKPAEAAQSLFRAADLAPPNQAAPLAALGLALDRLENHEKAQKAYRMALEREPERVSTLSNYGLSLAISGDLEGAETALRKAAGLPGADMRIRQNLALILGLQGRFDEMRTIDPSAPRRTVEENLETLRDIMGPYSPVVSPNASEQTSGPLPLRGLSDG